MRRLMVAGVARDLKSSAPAIRDRHGSAIVPETIPLLM
jgi:hypothetical protein